MDAKSANKLGSTIVLLLYFFMSGACFVQNVPSFITWIKYMSIVITLTKCCWGLGRSQVIHTLVIPPIDIAWLYPSIKKVGLEGQVFSVIAMVAMLVGYRLIAYTALMRIWCCKKI
ncbi:hypothetical protein CUMW_194690, partial [Citrus unshiu]